MQKQADNPFAYASRSLNPYEKNYGTSELEDFRTSVGSQALLCLLTWSLTLLYIQVMLPVLHSSTVVILLLK